MGAETIHTWMQRGLHVALVFAAAYVAVNPEWAWAAVALQALGQGLPQPR